MTQSDIQKRVDEVTLLAHWLHDNYEEIAKHEGWDTQHNCKVEFKDLPTKNKQVMLKLSGRLLQKFEGAIIFEHYKKYSQHVRAMQLNRIANLESSLNDLMDWAKCGFHHNYSDEFSSEFKDGVAKLTAAKNLLLSPIPTHLKTEYVDDATLSKALIHEKETNIYNGQEILSLREALKEVKQMLLKSPEFTRDSIAILRIDAALK